MSTSYTLRNGLGLIQISSPPLNSLSVKIRDGLLRGIDRATALDKVNGIIITSTGTGSKIFSSGYDTIEMIKGSMHQNKPSLEEINTCIESLTVPVLATFNGSAFGAALELGLSCHYRIATSNSQFGFTDSDVGLIPGMCVVCCMLHVASICNSSSSSYLFISLISYTRLYAHLHFLYLSIYLSI